MSEQGWHSPVYEVLDKRLNEKGVARVLTGGWKLAEMPEEQESDPKRGKRPYGVVNPVAVRNQKFTNKTKYADVILNFEIHADRFETLDKVVLPAITAALQHAAGLTIGNGTLKITMIRPGDVEYEKIEQIWTATAEFLIQANQPAAQSVA